MNQERVRNNRGIPAISVRSIEVLLYCSFFNIHKASRCTKSVRNRAILVHRRHRPILFQFLNLNYFDQTHFNWLYGAFSQRQCGCDSCIISGIHWKKKLVKLTIIHSQFVFKNMRFLRQTDSVLVSVTSYFFLCWHLLWSTVLLQLHLVHTTCLR